MFYKRSIGEINKSKYCNGDLYTKADSDWCYKLYCLIYNMDCKTYYLYQSSLSVKVTWGIIPNVESTGQK